ncbi:MAG TPA: hypothetical protein VF618_12070 [Thermoanaerobaculia bacterium]
MTQSTFTLPRCLAFLDDPYVHEGDTHVTLAEIRSMNETGVRGTSRIYTALVPSAKLARVLRLKAAMGWLMEGSDAAPDDRDFRITAPSGERFEPLIFGWTAHNRTVLTPNPKWLSALDLVPSIRLGDPPRIEWDDLEGPTYGVVEVLPVSRYEGPDDVSGARVRIVRRYAERLAAERRCAIMAVYYEQRSLSLDPELEALLGGEDAIFKELPGRSIDIKRTHDREYPYFVAAWGCRLVLKPAKQVKALEAEPKPALTWPGFQGPVNGKRAFMMSTTDRVYIRDAVLEAYEDRDEFDVDPTDGGIGYEGRWALSFSHRVGRDYFAYELKKIYEGCPEGVIRHVHQFAVEPEVAVEQRRALGNENIGTRATKLIEAFFSVVAAIAEMAAAVGLALPDDKIATPTKKEIDYHGWWTMSELKSLGYRAPQSMSRTDFLRRAVTVATLVERLQQRALRRLATTIGVPSKEIEDLQTLGLLGVLAMIGDLAHESGLTISDASAELASRWNLGLRNPALKVLFAGRALRDLASHATEKSAQVRIDQNLRDVGIDPDAHKTGWGAAVDQLYEGTTAALASIAQLLREAR